MLHSTISTIFVEGITTGQVLVGLFGVISAAAFTSLMITKIGEILLPRPKETRVADFLPFKKLREDGVTIECYDGTLVQVFKIKGIDATLVTPQQREMMLDSRKRFVDALAEVDVIGRIVTIRELSKFNDNPTYVNPILGVIASTWYESQDRVYNNKHYLILSIKDHQNAAKDLEQAAQATQAILDIYDITRLNETKKNLPENSPFSLFARLCNPITKPTPKIGSAESEDLNSLLTTDYIHFTGDEGLVRFFSGEKEKKCITIGIRASGDFVDEQMIADILSMDVELNVLHTFTPINKIKAMAMLMHQQRMAKMTTFSQSAVAEYDEALELVDSNGQDFQTLAEYSLTIFIFGSSDKEIEFGQNEIERLTRLYGVSPVREGWATQASFFAQFPTYNIYPRTYLYMSLMIASSLCLEKAAEGLDKCDWGNGPIATFRTLSGTIYKWQFHVSEADNAVGHCCIIGPTGQGKTTLLAFLAGMAMRHHDLRVYFFDRHRGIEIFTKAINGAYITFDGDENSTTMNPFSCSDSKENRSFLRNWMKSITNCSDSMSEREIARAVTTAFDYLKPEERTMKNLYKSCFSPSGFMRREMFRWVNDQQYGRIFNSQNDNLDLTHRFMAFDFTRIFEDETLAPAVISYIMHRIHNVSGSTGDPSLIMIDETAPMLKHPMFRDGFITGLQEGRKKRQAYLCAFQQPNIIDTLGVGEAIRGQCQSVIFFRNPQGMESDYENWNLTPREKDFIFGRSYKDLKYAILLSRPVNNESVIIDVDLGALGPLLKLYSSGRKHVLLAESLSREFGQSAWIAKYLERV
ncbi:MAG: Type IV secretion system protein virB4 [Alphaproteobacteria bacterium ADurb.Bin438]|nr:MAG: Type IV secretion system protein virB4 [Alphaproteobacteria bacterium ADurb.Bin438]